MKPIRKRAIRYLVICVAALVLACLGGGYLVYSRQQAIARAEAERMAAEQAAAQAAAEQAAAEAAARAAEEEAARQAALEAERQAAAQAAAEQAAADAKEKIIRQIRGLHNKDYVRVLYKVYVQYKSLKVAAAEMKRSYNYTIEVHRKALKEFEKVYSDLVYLC